MTDLRNFRVQLAERIRPHQIDPYYEDSDWVVQPKLDGVRLALVVDDGEIYGINRKGTKVAVPHPEVRQSLETLGNARLVLDGEWVGGVLWVFDVPYALEMVDPTTSYRERAVAVDTVTGLLGNERIRPVPFSTGEKKKELVERVRSDCGEGVMLRHLDGTYARGKRSRSLLKCKFTETVDCIVIEVGREGKASTSVGLITEAGKLVDVGSVKLSDHYLSTLQAGDVIEVEYLYCVDRKKPRLYQPVMKGKRDDKSALECTIDQLKFTDKTVRVYPEHRDLPILPMEESK